MRKGETVICLFLPFIISFSLFGCDDDDYSQSSSDSSSGSSSLSSSSSSSGSSSSDDSNVTGDIEDIKKTKSLGNVDYYEGDFVDGDSFEFKVLSIDGEEWWIKDGETGAGGSIAVDIDSDGDWSIAGLDSVIASGFDLDDSLLIAMGVDGDWYVDDYDTGILALADYGSDGSSILAGYADPDESEGVEDELYLNLNTSVVFRKEDGLWVGYDDAEDAYEAYEFYFTSYSGDEEEWIEDLASGDLMVTISFEENGGDEVPDLYFFKGEDVKLSLVDTKNGYGFAGWYLDSDLSHEAYMSFVASDDEIYYASWNLDQYSVVFLSDGVIVDAETVFYGNAATPPADPIKTGFGFLYWDLDGSEYDFSSPITSDLELTAVYDQDYLELPAVTINTDDSKAIMSKEEYIAGDFSVSNSDYDMDATSMEIKGRGNTSWEQPKKSYKIKFDKKQSLFGSSYKAKKWTLIANYSDKSLSRNYIAYEMSSKFSGIAFSSTHVFVDLYLNDQYEGVYLLCDQIETGEGRVDIDESLASDGDNGYLLEMDSLDHLEADPDEILGTTYFQVDGEYYSIKNPDTDDEDYQSDPSIYVDYISNYLEEVDDALDGNDYSKVTDLVDIQSFADTYIVQELMDNPDVGYSSFYLYKDKDGKLFAGPVWDFDIAAGNVNYDMGDSYECTPDSGLWAATANPFYSKLLGFTDFDTEVTQELTDHDEDLEDVIDLLDTDNPNGIYQQYKNAMNRNFDRWNIMGQNVWPEPMTVYLLGTFEKQQDYLYGWLNERLTYLEGIY